jgi:Fe-S cluster assembly scaffold protein SufB
MLQFRLRALDIFQRKPVPTCPSADLKTSIADFSFRG